MTDRHLDSQELQMRLLVWAARVLRTAAELDEDPDQFNRIRDTALRLEQMVRNKLARDHPVANEPIPLKEWGGR